MSRKELAIAASLAFALVASWEEHAASAEPKSRDEIVDAARELMGEAPLAALVTVGQDGAPNVRMMDPFAPDENMVVWLATNRESRKVRDIRKNPAVAVYYAVPDGPGYVTLKGTARLVDVPEEKAKRWKEAWAQFYESDRSDLILIQVTPSKIEVVSYRHGIFSEADDWSVPAVELDDDR